MNIVYRFFFSYSFVMNKLIIFDLDGTLADTREDLARALNLTRISFNLPELSLDEIIGYVGSGRSYLIEKSFQDASSKDLIQASTRFTKYYKQNLTVKTYLYKGVMDTIIKLHDSGLFLAVLSNKPGDMSREITSHFGLSKYLLATMGGGDAAGLKPAPDGAMEIIRLAEEKGFCREKDNVWMVGDHHTDMKLAEIAGFKSIYCSYGFGSRSGTSCDFEISDISELPDIVQN